LGGRYTYEALDKVLVLVAIVDKEVDGANGSRPSRDVKPECKRQKSVVTITCIFPSELMERYFNVWL
jgi:hypothetical protein